MYVKYGSNMVNREQFSLLNAGVRFRWSSVDLGGPEACLTRWLARSPRPRRDLRHLVHM